MTDSSHLSATLIPFDVHVSLIALHIKGRLVASLEADLSWVVDWEGCHELAGEEPDAPRYGFFNAGEIARALTHPPPEQLHGQKRG